MTETHSFPVLPAQRRRDRELARERDCELSMGAIDRLVSTSAGERHRQRMYLSGIQALVRLPLPQRNWTGTKA